MFLTLMLPTGQARIVYKDKRRCLLCAQQLYNQKYTYRYILFQKNLFYILYYFFHRLHDLVFIGYFPRSLCDHKTTFYQGNDG